MSKQYSNSEGVATEKLIIDADPGIDDSMAILMAFQSPQVDIIGLTALFGNVTTKTGTLNLLRLSEAAGRSDLSVAVGSQEPLIGGTPTVSDFVHGKDGLGNITSDPSKLGQIPLVPKSKPIDKGAAQFLLDKVSEFPGEVTILALGPLTNLASAIKLDRSFATNVKKIVILGGSFFALGNITPATEANIYQDPDAADLVFTSGANIFVVGLNITLQVKLTDEELKDLRKSGGKYAEVICNMCQYYENFYEESDHFNGIYLHDPTSFVALVKPELFTFEKGVVRVETQGICRGLTLMDPGKKTWNSQNAWTDKPQISVAMGADVDAVKNYVLEVLKKP